MIQLCTFLANGEWFAVEVKRVQEVLRYQHMTPVPGAHAAIMGLLNLRGELVLAIDLRRRLQAPPRRDESGASNVVVSSEGALVSLLVDEIGEVIEVDETCFEGAPQTLNERTKGFILGVYKLNDKLLLSLDVDKAVSSSELQTTN